MAGDPLAYTRELEGWLRTHSVLPLDLAIGTKACAPGALVWCELPFHWSDVASERRRGHYGESGVRSWFHSQLDAGQGPMLVHGTFDPTRLTCSTANSELSGVRSQYMLAHVARLTESEIELRPIAIATRLLSELAEWAARQDSSARHQRIAAAEVEQFMGIDFGSAPRQEALTAMRGVPEREVKRQLAMVLGEPTIPNDWGGEQSDLWTSRLWVDGRPHTAAFLLKGPAGGKFARPMTIGMLGKNGDQLQRLADTAAEVLVIQHCHEIRPEVIAMLESLASDYRNVRRYMILDGYETYAILQGNANEVEAQQSESADDLLGGPSSHSAAER